MKLVNADTIQNSEKEFIDAINAELDWVSIEKMILERHKLQLQDEVVYRDGDIVVHGNQIAYKLDFDITVSMSLIFNRDGECLEIETPGGEAEDLEAAENKAVLIDDDLIGDDDTSDETTENKRWATVAPELAAMIDDINQDS